MDDRVARWLEDFETFYRSIGLLGGGFKMTQDDRRCVAEGHGSSMPRRIRTRWFREAISRDNEEELLGAIYGSHALQWYSDDFSPLAWARALTAISRGSFMPVDLDLRGHADDAFIELRCTLEGRLCRLFHPAGRRFDRTLLYEVNRWIAHRGRQFAVIGGNVNGDPVFACLGPAEVDALGERGREPDIPEAGESEPAALVPLLEHFFDTRACALLLAATSFNDELLRLDPRFHFHRGAALLGMGRDDEGWKHIGIAQGRGVGDAMERIAAWRRV